MITLDDIRAARQTLEGRVLVTPLFRSEDLSRLCGHPVYFKAENLQHTGSFKIRGATSCIARLGKKERGRGVVAASAGNHAQGVALAASLQQVPATIFMPETAPIVKMERTRAYGATVHLVVGDIEAAMAQAIRQRDEKGLTYIHPFDDPLIQAGQGSVGLEILEQLPDVASVLVPVGGGGLISGIAVAMREQRPEVRILGVEAEGADPAARSLKCGKLVEMQSATTMADGIRVRAIAASTFQMLRRHVEAVLTVTDEAISQAMVFLMERARLVVEGAGAAGVAACLAGTLPPSTGPMVVVLSGGNADTNLLARVIQRGLTAAGRYILIQVRIPDSPGHLKSILDEVAARRANIVDISHHRAAWRVPLGDVEVEMLLETRDPAHGGAILQALLDRGMDARLQDRETSRRKP